MNPPTSVMQRLAADPSSVERLETVFRRLSWMRHDDGRPARALAALLGGLPRILGDVYENLVADLLARGDTMPKDALEECLEEVKNAFLHVEAMIHADPRFLM